MQSRSTAWPTDRRRMSRESDAETSPLWFTSQTRSAHSAWPVPAFRVNSASLAFGASADTLVGCPHGTQSHEALHSLPLTNETSPSSQSSPVSTDSFPQVERKQGSTGATMSFSP